MERFGATRDEWIARDLPGWLAANGIYAGLPELLHRLRAAHELYIVTTKQVQVGLLLMRPMLSACVRGAALLRAQARFTEALLHGAARLPLPAERIFSTAETGQPKSDVLALLQARHPGAACHFVEDKLSTLEKVRTAGTTGPRESLCVTVVACSSCGRAGGQSARAGGVGVVFGGLGIQHGG